MKLNLLCFTVPAAPHFSTFSEFNLLCFSVAAAPHFQLSLNSMEADTVEMDEDNEGW